MVDQLASLDVPTPAVPEPHEPPAGRRRGGRGLAAGGGRGAAQRAGRHRLRLAGAALAQAGLLHAAQPRARRARPARATATSPPRSGAIPTWWPTARCWPGWGWTTAAPRASDMEEAGIESSAREREAMKIERRRTTCAWRSCWSAPWRSRAAATRGLRRARSWAWWPRARSCASARRGSRASWACAACAAGTSSTSRHGAGIRSAQRSGWAIRCACSVERVDAPRGRVELAPARLRAAERPPELSSTAQACDGSHAKGEEQVFGEVSCAVNALLDIDAAHPPVPPGRVRRAGPWPWWPAVRGRAGGG